MNNVRTTKAGLQYYQDWDKYEGAIVMVNAKTIKLYKAINGERFRLCGKKDSIENLQKAYDNLNERVKNECNPQEVYFYEYNNHECQFGWSGDKEPMEIIKSIWGEEIANTIERL